MIDATPTERPNEVNYHVVGVLLVGALLTLGVGLSYGVRLVPSVALGATTAALNLLLIGRTVRAFLGRSGAPVFWGVALVLKMTLLFGGLFLLVKVGWVSLLPFLLGFGSMPLGIVLCTLMPFGPPAQKER